MDRLWGLVIERRSSGGYESWRIDLTERLQCGVQQNNKRNLILRRITINLISLIYRAPSYNPDADVPMTEAELSPLLSKPSPEGKKDKKEKDKKEKKDKEKKKDKKENDGKVEKKRSRKDMEDEEDEIEDKVIKQTKSNGVEESAAAKKEKSKFKKDHVDPLVNAYTDLQDGKQKKRKIAEAEEAAEATVKEDGLDEKARRKLEKKQAKQESRAAKKAKKA